MIYSLLLSIVVGLVCGFFSAKFAIFLENKKYNNNYDDYDFRYDHWEG